MTAIPDEDIGDEDTREATDLIDEVLVAVDGDRTASIEGRGHREVAPDAKSDNDKTADSGEDSTGNRLTATRARCTYYGRVNLLSLSLLIAYRDL